MSRISRRDYDPETWTEDRDNAIAHEDMLNRRGMQQQRDDEARVYGDSYDDWHGRRSEESPRMQQIMAETLATAKSLGRVVA